MSTPEKEVVDRMFAAFYERDLDAAVSTVSDDTMWIHHGTQKLPSLRFVGKNGVRQFFETSFTAMTVEYFRIGRTIQEGNVVVVFGNEKFTIEAGVMTQKWVQVYTVADGLITQMEEFATSVSDAEYGVIA